MKNSFDFAEQDSLWPVAIYKTADDKYEARMIQFDLLKFRADSFEEIVRMAPALLTISLMEYGQEFIKKLPAPMSYEKAMAKVKGKNLYVSMVPIGANVLTEGQFRYVKTNPKVPKGLAALAKARKVNMSALLTDIIIDTLKNGESEVNHMGRRSINNPKNYKLFPCIIETVNNNSYRISFCDFYGATYEAPSLEDAIGKAQLFLTNWLMNTLYGKRYLAEMPVPTSYEEAIKKNPDTIVQMVPLDLNLANDDGLKMVKKTLTIPKWVNQLAEQERLNFSALLTLAIIDSLGNYPYTPRRRK